MACRALWGLGALVSIRADSSSLCSLDEDKSWCATAQKILAEAVVDNANLVNVTTIENFSKHSVKECHPTIVGDGNGVTISVCDYMFCPDALQSTPSDIYCKMISEDKIASVLGLRRPNMRSPEVKNLCKTINARALEWANETLGAHDQGKAITLKNDYHVSIGPQWISSELSLVESDDGISVQSKALITTVRSWIFAGSHYCKLLAPSMAKKLLSPRSSELALV